MTEALPDILIAYHAHQMSVALAAVHAARGGYRLAEAHAAADGVSPAAVKRVLRLMLTDPAEMEREQRETAAILVALRAPDVEVQIDLFEQTVDESPETRRKRAYDAGYRASVLDKAPADNGYGPGAEQDAWLNGYQDFRSELAGFERQRRRRGAPEMAEAA